MRKLPIRTTLVTPERHETELKSALNRIGLAAVLSDEDIHAVYMDLAQICGAWSAEKASMGASTVSQALSRTGKNLTEASRLFSGFETGLRSAVESEATSLAAEILALDPTVGGLNQAKKLIASFRKDAAKMGHACLVAYADLARKAEKEGRYKLLWYDDFTALLLRLANKAGIKANLNKRRDNQQRGGWLFEAAQTLEEFLLPAMRSPSPEACGKRLEVSRKRLVNTDRK
jgi:hypothetical protein